MNYDFLIDTYADRAGQSPERLERVRRSRTCRCGRAAVDPRGRSVHEQMVHQCVSEDAWFRDMLGIDVGAPPLPARGDAHRLHQALRRRQRQAARPSLRQNDEPWWEAPTKFFDVERSRAWVMTRRMTHTSHHRGQQMAMLRMLGRDLHSNYGPTADTGGLMQDHAPTIYAYASLDALLDG